MKSKKLRGLAFVLMLCVMLVSCNVPWPDDLEEATSEETLAEKATTEKTTTEEGTTEAPQPEEPQPEEPIVSSIGLAYEVNSDGATCTITGIGTCTDINIQIPATINGYKVTSIGHEAFYYCNGLTSIVISDSVTSIGDWAFYYCSDLTSIVIPDSVTSIGDHAFYNCRGLTSIVIPDGVTSIGESAFSWCSGLTSIVVDEGNGKYHSAGNCLIETASKTLIAGCKNSVIPTDGSVTSIDSYAFYGCSGLTSIVIPDSVTSIGESAFYNCSSLTIVYYGGTAEDWAGINIGSYNYNLTGATRYYYSETQPTTTGNNWHYVDGVPTKW